jgi:hypothetical protein
MFYKKCGVQMKLILTILFSTLLFSQQTGQDILALMHQSYDGKWYKNLSFEQETIFYAADTVRQIQTWHEALSFPAKLHVKFGNPADGNGMFFAADSQYVFKAGKLVQKRPLLHPLLILGFDVYFQSAEKSAKQLSRLNFDLNILDEGIWQGRPVYIVGAKKGELKKTQFWIDKEHLYYVRSISYNKKYDVVSETEFNKYQRLGTGWIAPEVVFKRNGKITLVEKYTKIRTPKELDSALFTVSGFLKESW